MKIRYEQYLLVLLALILAFNSIDRLALGLAVQDIKAALHLTDTQIGLLSGIAFAFFYALMGIPIARWADRGNRVNIIYITTAAWSVLVALTGRAANFIQLLFIRVCVGIGEAGCLPPALSLIPDHFPRPDRPRAVAIYLMGPSLSFVIGYSLAGWLNQFYGWRAMFLALGAPGLVLALLVRLTLTDPRHDVSAAKTHTDASPEAQSRISAVSPQDFRSVCAALLRIPTFRHLLLALSATSFFTYGIVQWQPAFFIRSYHLQTGDLGTWLAATKGLCSLAGTYAGGAIASRWAGNNERLQLQGIAVVYVFTAVTNAVVYTTFHYPMAFALLAIGSLGAALMNGPWFSTIQTVVPANMRALATALVFLFSNLIGMGLGPLAVGALSDALRPHLADESLRYALLAITPGYIWCGWEMWRASATVEQDINSLLTREGPQQKPPASSSTSDSRDFRPTL